MRFDPLLVVFLAGTSLFLVVDHIYLAAPVIVALAGVFLRWRVPNSARMPDPLQRSWTVILAGFGCFVISVVFLNILHGDLAPRNFERTIPFVFLPAVLWAVRARDWKLDHWLYALGSGCMLALAVAIRDTFFLSLPRAGGSANNVIIFGNISVALGSICAVAAVAYPKQGGSSGLRFYLGFAALCAVGASLLSGSKGGWITIVYVAIIASFLATTSLANWQRLGAGILSLLLLFVIAALAPEHIVGDRVASGLQGALHYFETGEVSEGSVSARLELWKLGLHIFSESPIVGLGNEGLARRWSELTAAGAPFHHLEGYTTTDNELIGALAAGGLFGAIGAYLVYFGAFFAFWPWRKDHDDVVRCLAIAGITVVIAHLLFGLTTSILGRSMFRAEFVMLTTTLLAFMSLRLPRQRT